MEVDTIEFQAPSMSTLTEADACKAARNFDYEVHDSTQPINYFRAAIIKSAIKWALILGKYNPKDLKEAKKNKLEVLGYMHSRYPECGFRNYQQKQQLLLMDNNRVMRYLKGESRRMIFPKGSTVRIGNRSYTVKPDVAAECGNQIELIMFKIGKPTTTQTGRGNAFQRDMQLYAMILYGRQLGYSNITASFYYLKKTGETEDWASCDQNFFGGGGNIVQKTDLYFGEPNDLDKEMAALIQRNENGFEADEQDEKTCDYCRYYDICKYTLPPTRLEAESKGPNAATGEVKFSPAQEKAIGFEKGIARIIAGAGSGKTKVIVERVRRLLLSGVRAEEILMVTFTKAGAKEMKERIESAMGKPLPGLTVTTFNALFNDIVIDTWESLLFKRRPRVTDDVEQFAIIADLLNTNPILEWNGRAFMNFSTTTGFGTRGALQVAKVVFKSCKQSKVEHNGTVLMADAEAHVTWDEISRAALAKLVKLFDLYEEQAKERGLIEFDDQELLAFKVIEADPAYLAKRFAFKHVIVDEFQDTSEGQIEFVKKLRGLPTFESLMVVGDDFQAIYGFRDTSPEFIVNFEDYIGEPVTDICLDLNFRSTTEICEFAQKLIEPNRNKVNKDLIAARGGGMPVIVNGFYKPKDEMDYIVRVIQTHLDDGMRPEDIAVLAYTKNELVKIADALTKAGIPSMFGAPEPVMQNSRIRAILAFARVVRDNSNTKDALIAANAIIGGGIMDKPRGEIDAMVAAIVERAVKVKDEFTGRNAFIEYVDEIALDDEVVSNFKDSLENKDTDEIIEYCRNFDMYGAGVEYRRTEEYPGVALVTAHSSKGLEWPVIINTVNKYQKGSRMNLNEVEETRRLLFVSATRARDELYVTGQYANGTKYNKVRNLFLAEAMEAAGRTYDYDSLAD